MTSNGIVQKLWNYCNVLRDDGLFYLDYIEQLTFLLFLKMADEQTRPAFNKPSTIPKDYDWPSLLDVEGDALEIHYRHVLETLAKQRGMLGVILLRPVTTQRIVTSAKNQSASSPSLTKTC